MRTVTKAATKKKKKKCCQRGNKNSPTTLAIKTKEKTKQNQKRKAIITKEPLRGREERERKS